MLSLTRALAARQEKIRNNDKGFTLIELLVVVIIIGILAAIAIPIFLGQQASARDSAVKSDIANLKTALVAGIVEGTAFPSAGVVTSTADFTKSAESTLTLVGTELAFCVQGFDVTNTATSTFHATSTSGVADGGCPVP